MTGQLRHLGDKIFTAASGLSVLLLIVTLVLILGPLLYRGTGAVVFSGTVEFRKMQYDMHNRGNRDTLEAQLRKTARPRKEIYTLLNSFAVMVDTGKTQKRVRSIYRQFKIQLRHQVRNSAITAAQATSLKSTGKKLRDQLIDAYKASDASDAREKLDSVLAHSDNKLIADSVAGEFFTLARQYREVVTPAGLQRRQQYSKSFKEVQKIVKELLGPQPGEPTPTLAQFRYGATRWDRAKVLLDKLMWAETWVAQGPSQPLKKLRIPRAEQFRGTKLVELFTMMEQNLDQMLQPRWTFYWQYFIDDSTPGHFFGGVGPEIIGTLLLTLLTMIIAVPLGVTAAGYLVECTNETGVFIRVIRTCINTLAGVPSIVFGLFGLAFFVLYLQPRLALGKGASILAGAMTLGVLVLPILIRASEEALKSVPMSYKQASLALGAGKFRTFIMVTLPAATPGIMTGVILSMSRAAGETAPILLTATIALGPIPHSILQPTRTLSYGSYDLAVGDRIAAMVPHQQFGMVMTLIVLVQLLNLTTIIIRKKLERKLRGC